MSIQLEGTWQVYGTLNYKMEVVNVLQPVAYDLSEEGKVHIITKGLKFKQTH